MALGIAEHQEVKLRTRDTGTIKISQQVSPLNALSDAVSGNVQAASEMPNMTSPLPTTLLPLLSLVGRVIVVTGGSVLAY